MPACEISFDVSRIDFRATSDLLMASYWGSGRSDELHRRAFANSLCVGAYADGKQIGFGRAITDRTVSVYLPTSSSGLDIAGEASARGLSTRLSIIRIARQSRTGACRPTMLTRFMRNSASGRPPMAA